MKAGSKKIRSLRHRLRSRASSRSLTSQLAGRRRTRRHTRRHRKQRGGYAQYMNNMPNTPSYQVAGINLPSSQLALANPPPIQTLSNCVNCIDNFSRFPPPGHGFPSKGH